MLTAVGIAAEVGDMSRFKNAKRLMAFVGLVPSEHSSGSSVRRGGITKTGNTYARRLLVESAWTYRLQARKSNMLLKRQVAAPEAVLELSWKAQVRLCGKFQRLRAKGNRLGGGLTVPPLLDFWLVVQTSARSVRQHLGAPDLLHVFGYGPVTGELAHVGRVQDRTPGPFVAVLIDA